MHLFLFPFQLEKGVDGLFDSFARLDSRISSVGQTAAKIGDHLQVESSSMRQLCLMDAFRSHICLYYYYVLCFIGWSVTPLSLKYNHFSNF